MASVSRLELKQIYIVFTVSFSRKKSAPGIALLNPNKSVISNDWQDMLPLH